MQNVVYKLCDLSTVQALQEEISSLSTLNMFVLITGMLEIALHYAPDEAAYYHF